MPDLPTDFDNMSENKNASSKDESYESSPTPEVSKPGGVTLMLVTAIIIGIIGIVLMLPSNN